MRISHKAVWNCIQLIDHVCQCVIYVDTDTNRKKLMNYCIRFFEILEKFANVYLDYKKPNNINRFNPDTAAELKKVCECTSKILKFIKVWVSVVLRKNGKSQNVPKSVCFKAIKCFQEYLIKIDFLQQRNAPQKHSKLRMKLNMSVS